MRIALLNLSFLFLFFSCDSSEDIDVPVMEEEPITYLVSGQVIGKSGDAISGIEILLGTEVTGTTNTNGFWNMSELTGQNIISPRSTDYTFSPSEIIVSTDTPDLIFTACPIPLENGERVYNWLKAQQMDNGLLNSAENGNIVSLYDNALAALVYIMNNDLERAERIFDFFNNRIASELKNGPGGFSQFRASNGSPYNYRWMGDNAWFLIALNNYKSVSNSTKYDLLSSEISNWLVSLQDADGGLFAGYAEDGSLLNYKVTEGNIDAFNAINGYDSFHEELLGFLKNYRWDAADNNLMSWPENADYRYALDNQSWSYLIFPEYPVSALSSADRFLTTQIASINNVSITGYDIDEDRDAVFIEGTGQMALAYNYAGLQDESDFYIKEIEKILVPSSVFNDASGFPYASNIGTGYGDAPLWEGADSIIAISGGIWYLFAKSGFNPFEVNRNKAIPQKDMFWQ